MPDYGTNFSLNLTATAPSQPVVAYTGTPFNAETDFSNIGITISHSIPAGSTYAVEMLVWGYKKELTKTFTATAGQTDFTFDTDAPLSITSVKVNDSPVSDSDYTTSGGQLSFNSGLSADDEVEIKFVKANIAEADAEWEAFSATKTIAYDRASAISDGSVSVSVKVRDDVLNTSNAGTATAGVDASAPVVTITNIVMGDGSYTTTPQWKISTQPGRNSIAITFTASDDFVEWVAMVVNNGTDAHGAVTNKTIPETGGSQTSDTGSFSADTPYTCTIKGADYASAVLSDGDYNVKIFVKDSAGNWSE